MADNITGKVTIADRFVMQLAVYAAKKCSGVADMSDRSKKQEAFKSVTGQKDIAGIYINKTKEGVILDVYVACKPASDLSEIKREVREQITEEFLPTGVNIADVKVHINSVKQ